MKSKILIILLSFLYASVFAQDDTPIDQAKFGLIKNAVWFYSKDTKTEWGKPNDCATSKTFDELTECAKGMKGVSERIIKWRKTSTISNAEGLNNLKDLIEKDILIKEHRKKLPEYKKFQSEASQIIANAEKELAKTKTDSPKTTEEAIQEQPAMEEKPKQEREKTVDEDKARAKKSLGSGFDIPLLVTLLIAIIALIYSLFSGISLKNEMRNLKGEIDSNKDDTTNRNLAQRLNSLEKEIKTFDGSIDTLREELSKKIKNIITAQNNPVQQTVNPIQSIHKPTVVTKYAKYADLEDGFSLNQLSDEQDEKIFEIFISPNNTAKFRIVSNRNCQLLALSNTNLYFNKTCKYDSVPTSNSTITTETEGELKLQGNKWQIVSPAKINFS